VECNEDDKFCRKVKDHIKGNEHNNNKQGDDTEEIGGVGAREDRDN
jgi:hypothetical protein